MEITGDDARMSSLQKNVPFDQYSRQYQVAAMINELRKKGKTFRILDVGGYKGKTAEFFPDDEVIVLDVFDVNEPNYVKGDGSNLPFEDESFDFVVNFDVLEHIPQPDRRRFVQECLRTARRAAFFSAPHKTKENEKAEQSLNDFYRELHKKDHRWLKEHIAYGLPDYLAIEKFLISRGHFTSTFSSNDTLVWQLMQGAIFLNSKFPLAAEETVAINQYYNQHFPFDGGVDRNSTYRLILMAAKSKQDTEQVTLQFGKKNKPLTLEQKLEISHQIHYFEALLLKKLTKENSNLHKLHEHESRRAEELHRNGEELWRRINKLEAEIELLKTKNAVGFARRSVSRLKRKLKKNDGHIVDKG
jgi:SAM-dependent methyltransferase